MISLIVIDVIFTSILTSIIVAGVVFWIMYRHFNNIYKKKIDEISKKISDQNNVFNYQVDSLKQNLRDIIKTLDILKKRK